MTKTLTNLSIPSISADTNSILFNSKKSLLDILFLITNPMQYSLTFYLNEYQLIPQSTIQLVLNTNALLPSIKTSKNFAY